ncbi:MFS transporter [Streptomyces sp. LZ34]
MRPDTASPRRGERRAAGPALSERVRSLRAATAAMFILNGFVFTGWVTRIPAVKQQVGATPGQLGLALLAVPVGAVGTMAFTERLCRREGSRRVALGGAVLLSGTVVLPACARTPLSLGLALLLFGVACGALDVGMNATAVDVATLVGRPILPRFHAAYSVGCLLGSGLGGLLAARLSPVLHLLLLGLIGLAVAGWAGRHLIPRAGPGLPPAPAPDGRRRRGRHPRRMDRRLLVFGLIALCVAYGEGALADWGALHFTQSLGTGPALAAVAFTPFALATFLVRLGGTRLIERLGVTRVLVCGGLTAAAGMLLGALAPNPWLALVGFTVTGGGLATSFPIAMARAGALAGPTGIAVASTLGYLGLLAGPPAIGFLTELVGLPVALLTISVLAAVSSLLALTARRGQRDQHADSEGS